MKTKGIACLIFLSLLMIMCHRDSSVIENSKINTGLFGTWFWLKTIPRESGISILTPEVAGHTKRYSFERDSVFKAWKNDSLIFSGTYSLTIDTTYTISTNDKCLIIRIFGEGFPDGNQWLLTWIHQDTMKLSGLCFDCSDQVFVRIL